MTWLLALEPTRTAQHRTWSRVFDHPPELCLGLERIGATGSLRDGEEEAWGQCLAQLPPRHEVCKVAGQTEGNKSPGRGIFKVWGTRGGLSMSGWELDNGLSGVYGWKQS